jgi:tetratricopeptide (TPR) repeat protein
MTKAIKLAHILMGTFAISYVLAMLADTAGTERLLNSDNEFVFYSAFLLPAVVVISPVIAIGIYVFALVYRLFVKDESQPKRMSFTRRLFRWGSAYRRLHRKIMEKRVESARRKELAKQTPVEIINTEAAIEDMRLARSYLDDWLKDKEIKDSKKALLSFAAKYIQVARTKDPNARLVVQDPKEPETYTQDDLAAETLFYESQYLSGEKARKRSLAKARDILQQALTYKPESVQYREHLADVFLNLHDKASAMKVAYEALRNAPYDLQARKLLDRIDAAPATTPPSPIDGTTVAGAIAAIGALAMLGGLIVFFMGIFGGYAGNGIALFVLGAIATFVGNLMQNSFLLRKAIDDQTRKRGSQ